MSDVKERGHWDAYMNAYQEALDKTSRPWAPWYAIPADDKPYMRLRVAEIIVDTLKSLPINYPTLGDDEMAKLSDARDALVGD